MLYYTDTMQAKAMKLMASKLAVAGIIEGTFSDEGLAAMSDVKDMTSQMAKELMLGIRDNVEDIAASFKKMAIINPTRNIQQVSETAEPTVVQMQKPVANKTSSVMDAAVRQALYEGLLEKSMEQKKKRSKKVEIDENQITLFDFAA